MINKPNILIICEGYEEYEYLEKLKELKVWDNYNIKLINAESNGTIFPIYQFNYQNDDYDLILIMTDTDRPNYDDFILMNNKINSFHDVDNFSDEIVIFGNPCTMQFILNHFSEECVYVIKANKKKNAELIKNLTGVENYNAHKDQREAIFCKITKENYEKMKNNILNCSDQYTNISSTNFLRFIKNLESNDTSWINDIVEKLQ